MNVLSNFLFFSFFLSSFSLAGQSDIDYFKKGKDFFRENLDSSIYYLEKGVPFFAEKADWGNHINCINALASCYFLKGNYIQSYEHTLRGMEAATDKLSKKNAAYGDALNNLAAFAQRKGDFQKAIDLFQHSLTINQENNFVKGQFTILNNLGICFSAKGDYSESKRYYQRALYIGLKGAEKVNPDISIAYSGLASVYNTTGQIDTALQLFQKTLDKIEEYSDKEDGLNARKKYKVHLSMAKIFIEKEEITNFQKQIRQAQKQSQIAFKRASKEAYLLLGQWELKQNSYQKAIPHFEKAIQLAKTEYKNLGQHPAIGETYYYLAKTYLGEGNLLQSLEYSQLALQQYSKKFNSTNFHENPLAEDLSIDQNLLKILRGKANALFQLYQQTKEEETLLAAKHTFQLAIEILNKLRQSYLGIGSKEILAENVLPIFEGALNCLFSIYEREPRTETLEEAFQISENSKAILLLESINETTALGFAGIPEELLLQERTLKRDIAYYEKQLMQVKSPNVEKGKTIEAGLFSLEKEHRELIHLFEKKYPDYYRLKYNTEIADLTAVRKKLTTQKSALLEYFVGEKSLFTFCIQTNTASWHHQKKTPAFNQNIQTIRDLLIQPPSSKNPQIDFDFFTQTAHTLYQQLIGSVNLDPAIHQLLIIPDDVLAYLPFEILLSTPASSKINYSAKRLAYLLNDFQVSYNYSATLLCRARKNQQKAPKNFIGFAPSFQASSNSNDISSRVCSQESLFQLNCNQQEVEQISAIFNGKSLLGTAANKAQFSNYIEDYRIAHFATHSCLDDENPMLNKIFLQDTYLSNHDLFNLQIQTELSVLSACNTGNGKLRRGEGVMSLSRGFMHAGCPSVLMSLWAVEDCTTATLMTQYYQGIKAGKTKDQALQESKKHYLQNANKLTAHPFYWAPFVQFGTIDAMDFSRDWTFLYWVLLALLGFFFILYWSKDKLRKK